MAFRLICAGGRKLDTILAINRYMIRINIISQCLDKINYDTVCLFGKTSFKPGSVGQHS